MEGGVKFSVSIANPYAEALAGQAWWILDASAFAVEPKALSLRIPPEDKQELNFTLKAFKETAALASLPRLEFNLAAGGTRHRFHREVRFLEELSTPYRRAKPVLDGQLVEWDGVPSLKLAREPRWGAELRTCHDGATLFLGVVVPAVKVEEGEELGFKDDLQIGLARRLGDTDFGADFLRLGFSRGTREVRNRTPGRKTEQAVPGISYVSRTEGERTGYEIAVPIRLIKGLKPGAQGRLILDLSFLAPDGDGNAPEPLEPAANTFAYRVRYGNDSLIPVDFVELSLERNPP